MESDMISGIIKAVNSKPHTSKAGSTVYGLLVNDKWYNLVSNRPANFEKGKKIEFDLLDGNTKYIDGKTVKYRALNASNDDSSVPATTPKGMVEKSSQSVDLVAIKVNVDHIRKELIDLHKKIDKLNSKVEQEFELMKMTEEKVKALDFSDLEEPPFDTDEDIEF